jgi:hypothetical protein
MKGRPDCGSSRRRAGRWQPSVSECAAASDSASDRGVPWPSCWISPLPANSSTGRQVGRHFGADLGAYSDRTGQRVAEFARQNAEEVVEEALPLCALAGEGSDNTAERYQQVTRRFPNARVGSLALRDIS